MELGPDGVLTAMGQDCLDQETTNPTNTATTPLRTLRHTARSLDLGVAASRRRPRPKLLSTSLAQLHTRGVVAGWDEMFTGTTVRRVALPTYAFQHQRYWLEAAAVVGDVSGLGLNAADHPLLGAAVELGDDQGVLCTGRLSLHTHPWLADHAVAGVVLVPGTAFVELAVRAGDQVGCGRVLELTLEAPLVLPEQGGVQIQVVVGAGEESTGVREVSVYARAADTGPGAGSRPWTRHASGVLGVSMPEQVTVTDPEGVWPPQGAVAVAVDDAYERLAGAGLEYGPVFQGLQKAWQRGDELFAEVVLPEQAHADAAVFGVHPALLDAALHVWALGIGDQSDSTEIGHPAGTEIGLAFSWNGVTLHAGGATALRVRSAPAVAGGTTFTLTDTSDTPVATIESLRTRPISLEQLRTAAGTGLHESLFRLEWTPVPTPTTTTTTFTTPVDRWATIGAEIAAPDTGLTGYRDLDCLTEALTAGAATPEIVVTTCSGDTLGEGPVGAAHSAAKQILAVLQAWLGEPRYAQSRLVVLTRGAVAVAGEDITDLAAASVWGLIRTAQSEHPDRFLLIDTDTLDTLDTGTDTLDGDGDGDGGGVLRVVAAVVASGEPQIAVRAAGLYAPRLARIPATHDTDTQATTVLDAGGAAAGLDVEGTVLITGGTGTLGAVFARHLITRYGARHLLLTSRSGLDAVGAVDLQAELAGLGAQVRVAACDVSDRDSVAGLLAEIPVEHPLTAVIHTAGILDDGIIESLTGPRIDTVLRPKVDAGWYLHELTQDMDLSMFVVFSSAAGVFGNAGQGNYAAGNAFLDGLAQHRRAQGLPATALAWGLWAQDSGLTAGLAGTDRSRMSRSGVAGLSTEEGLALFDTAGLIQDAVSIPMRWDPTALRTVEAVPALLRGLVRGPARRRASATTTGAASALAQRLAGVPGSERDQILAELVRTQVAVVLGHSSPDTIDSDRAFTELGFDSLTAVELRNRLATATGLRLPATLIFDYPSTTTLARYLAQELSGGTGRGGAGAGDRDRGGRADRDRGDGVPVARWCGLSAGFVGSGGSGWGCDHRVPGRSWLGCGGFIRPGSGGVGQKLYPCG